MVSRDKLWEQLQQKGIPLCLQQVLKSMYTTIMQNYKLTNDIHGEVKFEIGFEMSPFPHVICLLY